MRARISLLAKELRTQAELDAFATSELEKRKDIAEGLRVTALASAGIIGGENKWIPGYSLIVNSPGDGIDSGIFRITAVHTILEDRPILMGHNYIVEVDLVPNDLPVKSGRQAFVSL